MATLINHVVTKQGYTLSGDSRGIITEYQKRAAVWNWASENNIKIEYQGSLDGYDLWYVKNDRDRAWFALRWL